MKNLIKKSWYYPVVAVFGAMVISAVSYPDSLTSNTRAASTAPGSENSLLSYFIFLSVAGIILFLAGLYIRRLHSRYHG